MPGITRDGAVRVLWLLVIAGFIQIFYYYPQLPDVVATHYNFKGEPDAWGSKSTMVILYGGLLIFISVIFLIIDKVLKHISPEFINIPNKEYWLAPERREQTLETFSAFMLWIGNITLLFMLALFQYLFTLQSQNDALNNGYFWGGLLTYLLLMSWILIKFYLTFRRASSKQSIY
ncbi:MAG: DUF1648 domain-containing protein [Calditrichaeota bacterium]|nr:MAG: DUF1648 domain-containing protein [Calditrichota bacterium]